MNEAEARISYRDQMPPLFTCAWLLGRFRYINQTDRANILDERGDNGLYCICINMNLVALDVNDESKRCNMKKRSRITLCGIIAVIMAFAMAVPMSVSAADDYQEWTSTNSLPTSGTYKLMGDVTLSGKVTVGSWASSKPENPAKILTLDLNGHTVTASEGEAFFIQTNGRLIIEDSADGGKITNDGATGSSKNLIQVNNGSFVLKGGTVENALSNGTALFVNGDGDAAVEDGTVINKVNGGDAVFVNGGDFEMSGGTVKTESTYASDSAIYANNSAESIKISGGTVESSAMGVYAAATPVKITGGSIDTAGYALQTRYANIEPAEGNDVVINSDKGIFYTFSGSENVVNGGEFTAPVIVKEYTSTEGNSELQIQKGTFSNKDQLTDYIADGKTAIGYDKDGQVSYYIGDEESISEIISDASEGDKIEVISGNANINIPVDGVEVTNTGGGTVTVNDEPVTGEPVMSHVHTWGEPVWNWAEDNLSATVTFTCTKDESHVEMPAVNVTTAKTDETCTEDGKMVYTAKAVFNGTEYTNIKTVVIPASGHDYENGVCTVCGAKEAAGNAASDSSAETGDDFSAAPMIALMSLAAAAAAGTVVYGRRRKA